MSIILRKQASSPDAILNNIIIFSKVVSGVSELFLLDDAGNESQITDGGKIKGALPAGGVTGQVPVKLSNTDGDIGWGNVSSGPTTGRVVATPGVTPAVLDTQYIIGAPGVTLALPDFTLADCGRSIVIVTSAAGTVTAPPSGAVFSGQGEPPTGAVAGNPYTLAAGAVFTLRCFFSTDLPLPYYLIEGREIPTRSDGDVTVTVLSVPSDAVLTPNGDGTITLSASPSGTERLVYDVDTQDVSNFNPASITGQGYTCVFPWGGSTGKGTIVKDDSALDWSIVGIRSDISSAGLLGGDKAHYTPQHGLIYKGRTWETNTTETGLLRLLRQPLEIYPRSGEDPLLGDTSTTFRGLKHNQILIGKTNRIDGHAAEGAQYALLVGDIQITSDLEARMGERFSLVNESSLGYVAQVSVPTPWMTLVAPDGTSGDTLSLSMDPGVYLEWQLAPGGVWRLVSYINPTPTVISASGVGNDSLVVGADVAAALNTLDATISSVPQFMLAPESLPDAFDLEARTLTSGDLSLAGWTVALRDTPWTTLTYAGTVDKTLGGAAAGTYRASIVGGVLILQLPSGTSCQIYKAITGTQFTIKSHAWCSEFTTGNSSYQFLSTAPNFIDGTAAHFFYAGIENTNMVSEHWFGPGAGTYVGDSITGGGALGATFQQRSNCVKWQDYNSGINSRFNAVAALGDTACETTVGFNLTGIAYAGVWLTHGNRRFAYLDYIRKLPLNQFP